MKTMKTLFTILAAVAGIAVLTGHPWHLASLLACLVMAHATEDDEDGNAGRRE